MLQKTLWILHCNFLDKITKQAVILGRLLEFRETCSEKNYTQVHNLQLVFKKVKNVKIGHFMLIQIIVFRRKYLDWFVEFEKELVFNYAVGLLNHSTINQSLLSH